VQKRQPTGGTHEAFPATHALHVSVSSQQWVVLTTPCPPTPAARRQSAESLAPVNHRPAAASAAWEERGRRRTGRATALPATTRRNLASPQRITLKTNNFPPPPGQPARRDIHAIDCKVGVKRSRSGSSIPEKIPQPSRAHQQKPKPASHRGDDDGKVDDGDDPLSHMI
jgi:hypothetical protein